MRGLDAICMWLDAELFQTDFRPVKLEQHVVLGEAIFSVQEGPPPSGQSVGTQCDHTLQDTSKLVAFPQDMLSKLNEAGMHFVRSILLPEKSSKRRPGRTVEVGDNAVLQLAIEGMQV